MILSELREVGTNDKNGGTTEGGTSQNTPGAERDSQ